MLNLFTSSWLGKVVRAVQQRKREVGLTCDEGPLIAAASYPQLYALGNESSGKSTVLSRVLQIGCLPRGPHIETRFPLRIELRHDPDAAAKAFSFVLQLVPFPEGATQAPLRTTDANEVRRAIEVRHDEIKKSGKGLDPRVSVLKVFAFAAPNVDIVDLPGLLSVCQEGEPDNMASLAEQIAREHLEQRDAIALVVSEAHTNPRHSAALALVARCKPRMVLHVLTKVDKHLDSGWKDNEDDDEVPETPAGPPGGPALGHVCKSSPLSAHFRTLLHPDAVSLRNFATKDFEEAANAERAFFSTNMSEQERAVWGERVGIDALLRSLNELSEGVSRPSWRAERLKAEQQQLSALEARLEALGPPLSRIQLAACVVELLLPAPCEQRVENLLLELFDQTLGKQLPPEPLSAWSQPQLDPNAFLQALRAHVPQRLAEIAHSAGLQRYQQFFAEASEWWTRHVDSATRNFVFRWEECEGTLRELHAVGLAQRLAERWQHAAVHCALQSFFVPLLSDRFNDNQDIDDLTKAAFGGNRLGPAQVGVALTMLWNFSNQELSSVCTQRQELLNQINAMRDVIALL